MAIPTWLASIPKGTWGTLPNSVLSSSGVMEAGPPSAHAGFIGWSGGILNTKGIYNGSTFISGTFLVIKIGGHTDYGGNEMYAYGPIEADSPQWYEVRSPTSPQPTNVSVDGSGNPCSNHVYDSVQYVGIGSRNWLVQLGGSFRYTDDNTNPDLLVFDFNQVSPNSNQPWSKKAGLPGTGGGFADASALDPTQGTAGIIWYHSNNSNDVNYYDIAADSHTRAAFKSPGNFGQNAKSAIDTGRGIWATWDRADPIYFYQTNNGVSNDYYLPTTRGDIPSSGDGSLIYDSAKDCFVLWQDMGRTYYELHAPSSNVGQGGDPWTWVKRTPSFGGTPDAMTNNGSGTVISVFGRLQYFKNADFSGYLLLNIDTGSINFLRSDVESPWIGSASLKKFPQPELRR